MAARLQWAGGLPQSAWSSHVQRQEASTLPSAFIPSRHRHHQPPAISISTMLRSLQAVLLLALSAVLLCAGVRGGWVVEDGKLTVQSIDGSQRLSDR